MYNFLDPNLLPKVSTQSPSMENYEPTNLISENFLIKSRGYLAYTSIKPPVDLDFELLCPVTVRHITIATTVGTQKTTGIEILAKNSTTSYVSIAKATFTEPGVVFCNGRLYSKFNPPASTQNFHLAFFNRGSFRIFSDCNFLKIRIFRTEKSVPCLGKVEIWGVPSKSSSETTVKTIEALMKRKSDSRIFGGDKEAELKSNKLNIYNEHCNFNKIENQEELEIPEDFKDALTWEIMAIPMTLPSGHTVDQTTIEKCIQNDNACGRQALDPFTGLEFTETRKPLLNISLKARIDMFLFKNSHCKELFSVGRTLGRGGRSLIEDKSKRNDPMKDKSKRKSTYFDNYDCSKKLKINSANGFDISSSRNNCTDSKNVTNDSLEDAISRAMCSKDFMRFTVDNVEEKPEEKLCSICDIKDNLYVIPCAHLFCRRCLLEVCKELVCKKCEMGFARHEPKKFHF